MNAVATSAPPRPQLTLLAHVDATPHDLEVWETAEVESFEKAWRPDANVVVQLRRDPVWLPGKIALGGLEFAALPFAAHMLVSGGLPLLSSPVGVGIAACTLGLGMLGAWKGARTILEARTEMKARKEPMWHGVREFAVGPDRTPAIDSEPVNATRDEEVTQDSVTRFLADNMKKYPSSVTAVMFSGHGLAWEECASYPVESIRKALEESARQAGRKPDVVILEACLMSNLEALDRLKDTARYAIVSEETMGASGLPWKSIIDGLPKSGLTAEKFGRLVVRESKDSEEIDTLALVDLSRIGALSASFARLASELRRVVADGRGDAVRAALEEAGAFPRQEDAASLRDLGQLTEALTERVDDPDVARAAADVQARMGEAIVASTSSPEYDDVTHMTVQGDGPGLDSKDYAKETGFQSWTALLEDLRK
jgi:hypothetical protein